MSRMGTSLVLLACWVAVVVCRPPPVEHMDQGKHGTAEEHKKPEDEHQAADFAGLEYAKYLKEVVEVLEKDEKFKKKLENATREEIENGTIARHLKDLGLDVRNKLHEVKRQEIARLRDLIMIQSKEQGPDSPGKTRDINRLIAHIHDDPENKDPERHDRFDVADLKHLIQKASKDLTELDKKRKDEFKDHEMEKKKEHKEALDKIMDEEERKKAATKQHEQHDKHMKHHGETLHEPGKKAQLEEVWEEEDHMKDVPFDPKTFFNMHDLNGDGNLDEEEVEALFEKELNKMDDPKKDDDYDPDERSEERERMREHVYQKMDKDGNKEISWDEFMATVNDKNDFEKDESWDMIDDEKEFTDEEYDAYLKQHESENEQIKKHEEEEKRHAEEMKKHDGAPPPPPPAKHAGAEAPAPPPAKHAAPPPPHH